MRLSVTGGILKIAVAAIAVSLGWLSCSSPVQQRTRNIEIPPPDSRGATATPDHIRDTVPVDTEREPAPRLAVWPFSYATTTHVVNGPWLLAALVQEESESAAAIVTAAVTRSIASDPLRRYQVVERLAHAELSAELQSETSSVDQTIEGALRRGLLPEADFLVVGSCLPGISPQEYAVEMRLLELGSNPGEVVAARSGVCQPCTTAGLEALSQDLARELVSEWGSFDWGDDGPLPGSR